MTTAWQIERREKDGEAWGAWILLEAGEEIEPGGEEESELVYDDEADLEHGVTYHYRVRPADNAEAEWLESNEVIYVGSPVITISHVTRYKISSILGFDVSTATFTADQDLTEFVARIGGYDHATGPLAYSGGALDEGDDGFAVVEHDDLVNLGEGDHRINIYGKNSTGLWTEYMDNGNGNGGDGS